MRLIAVAVLAGSIGCGSSPNPARDLEHCAPDQTVAACARALGNDSIDATRPLSPKWCPLVKRNYDSGRVTIMMLSCSMARGYPWAWHRTIFFRDDPQPILTIVTAALGEPRKRCSTDRSGNQDLCNYRWEVTEAGAYTLVDDLRGDDDYFYWEDAADPRGDVRPAVWRQVAQHLTR